MVMPLKQQSDEELIKAYFSGDAMSLELLVARYLGVVFRFVRSMVWVREDAEDITQEVFVKAWKNLGTFNCEKSFKTWLFAIAKNASFDYLRKKKQLPFSKFEDEQGRNTLHETLRDTKPSPYEHAESQEFKKTVDVAMAKLSGEERAAVLLRLQEEFSFAQMAEVFGEPLDTVRSRYRRAIIKLRELLGGGSGRDAPKQAPHA